MKLMGFLGGGVITRDVDSDLLWVGVAMVWCRLWWLFVCLFVCG